MRRNSNPDLCRNHHFLAADLRVALALPFGAAGAASASSAAASTGSGLRLGRRTLAVMVGAAPSVRISVIRTKVNSGRKPRLRREFLRRRFLNAMILGPRPCSSTSAATEAPVMVGLPSVTLSPPTSRTSPNCTISPGSPLSRSTLSMSWAATRYCLPPVLMTANIVLVLVLDPGARNVRTGFFQSVDGFDGAPLRIAPMGCRRDAYDGRGPDCQESKANGSIFR